MEQENQAQQLAKASCLEARTLNTVLNEGSLGLISIKHSRRQFFQYVVQLNSPAIPGLQVVVLVVDPFIGGNGVTVFSSTSGGREFA
jgi:hypothetical protein